VTIGARDRVPRARHTPATNVASAPHFRTSWSVMLVTRAVAPPVADTDSARVALVARPRLGRPRSSPVHDSAARARASRCSRPRRGSLNFRLRAALTSPSCSAMFRICQESPRATHGGDRLDSSRIGRSAICRRPLGATNRFTPHRGEFTAGPGERAVPVHRPRWSAALPKRHAANSTSPLEPAVLWMWRAWVPTRAAAASVPGDSGWIPLLPHGGRPGPAVFLLVHFRYSLRRLGGAA